MKVHSHYTRQKGIWSRDEGAVTVDWVVLTAIILVVTISALTIFTPAAQTSKENLDDRLDEAQAFIDTLKQ